LLLKKIGVTNYFIVLLILLALTAMLILSTFIFTAIFPDSLGRGPYEYEVANVCEFEPWAFEVNDLKVYFPQGGIIINLHESENKRSVLLLGDGRYEQGEQTLDSLDTGGLFMVLEFALFEELRGGNIFMPVEDEELLSHVNSISEKQIGIQSIWKDMLPLAFHTNDGLVFYYLVSAEGNPILPPKIALSLSHLLGSFLIYSMFFIIILLVITIFSPDHHYSKYWYLLGKTPPGAFSQLAILPVLLLILTADIIARTASWPVYAPAVGYLAAVLILIFSSKYGKIDYLDFGLRRDRVRHGYLLAVIAAAMLLGITRGIPIGFGSETIMAIISLPLIFLLVALPHEMIWRGYIQAVLSRRLDPTKGLLAMIVLTALVRFIFLAVSAPWLIVYPYTYLEIAVLVPGTAAILGYIYLRTENILCCALMHSLVLWLPGIIRF